MNLYFLYSYHRKGGHGNGHETLKMVSFEKSLRNKKKKEI